MNIVREATVEIKYSGGRNVFGIGVPKFIYKQAERAEKEDGVVSVKVTDKSALAGYEKAS